MAGALPHIACDRVFGYAMDKNFSENIIELKGIKKRYDDNFEAVKDFNLQVKKGEFISVIGSNGSGKTTILNLINKLAFKEIKELENSKLIIVGNSVFGNFI